MITFRRSCFSSLKGRPGRRKCCATLALFIVSLGSARLASAQALEVTPDDQTVFLFSGFEGGPFVPQTLTTWALDNTDARDADFQITSNQPWLKIDPAEGALGGLLERDIDAVLDDAQAEGLAPGLYTAIVSFKNLTNGAGDTQRTVRLQVAPANFTVQPAFINATAYRNGANPADQVVTLTSNGQSDLNYQVAWTAQSWLSVNKTSGTVPGGGSDSIRVSFNIAGLAAGTYTSALEITNMTNGAGSRAVPIALTIKSLGAGSVTLTPDQDIVVSGPVGELPLASQQSVIANGGDQSVSWSTLSSEPWVSVTPSSGDLAASDGFPGGLDERTVSIRVNSAAQTLPPGSTAASVTFQTITTHLGTVTGVAFGTRVVYVVANPVLSLSMPEVGGEVTTSPAGTQVASSSTTQRLTFNFGQVVVVTATPADGYEFRGWAGDFPEDAQTVNPLILPMDSSKSLGALIAPILRTLTVSAVGGGSGTIDMSPTGVEIENALEARYTNGTEVQLTADPDAGSVFRGWSGNVPPGEEFSNPLTIVMDRERVISARFEPALTIDIHVTGEGSVAVNPDLPSYAAGMTVTLTAVADEGFHFAGWSGGASGTNPTLMLTVSGDLVVNATFLEGDEGPGNGSTATLTVEVEGDGVVTPSGGEYDMGKTLVMIATPTIQSKFVRWEEDASGTELAASIVMDQDRLVRAIFEPLDEDAPGRPTTPAGPSACGAAGMIGMAGIFLGWMTLAGFSRRRQVPRS